MSDAGFRYWAFISYSHQDEAWAQWLHRSLETYRVPRRLVGRPLGDGQVPRRLFPVFRDRDELPSSAELGGVINEALRASRNLIVICSPRSATSRWVNEEIRAFRSLGRHGRLFCLIVDGEPHASGSPETAFSECFPPALREAGFEPIAADARPRKDGKAGAKLKLISGLIGVGLDELRQREKQRQLWRRLQVAAAAMAFVGLVAGAWNWYLHQRDTREREILVEQLVDNGRRELLDGRQARAAVFLTEALRLGEDTIPVRFMLGQAMQPLDALTPVRVRHGGQAVRRAAFSRDGKQFALAVVVDGRTVIKLYDADSGAGLGTLEQAPPWPRSLQFLPDGRHLLASGVLEQSAAGDAGALTSLWRVDDPKPRLSLAAHVGRGGEAVSTDAAVLALAADRGIVLVDVAKAHALRRLEAGIAFSSTSFSPDGTLLAAGALDGRVHLWNAKGYTPRRPLAAFQDQPVAGVLFSRDGRRLLAISPYGDIRIWDVVTGALTVAFGADPRWVGEVRFNADGRRLLTIGSEGYKVWSAARGILLFDLRNPLARDATADLSPDGNTLVTADDTSSVSEVWAVRARRRLYSLDLHTSSVTAAAFDPTGRKLVLGSKDGMAEVWNMNVNPLWGADLAAGLAPLRVAMLPPSPPQLLIAGGDFGFGRALLVDWQADQVRADVRAHSSFISDAMLDQQGRRLLTASADGSAGLWDVTDGKRLKEWDFRPHAGYQAAYSPDGSRAVITSTGVDPESGRAALLLDGRTGEILAPLGHGARIGGFAFSPEGRQLATLDALGHLKVWNGSGSLLWEIQAHTGVAQSVQWDHAGRRLLTAGSDAAVRIWEAGKAAAALEDRALGIVHAVAWSPDDRSIAVGTESGTIWLWEPATGVTRALRGHSSAAEAVHFLHGGRILLSRGYDGSVRAWDPLAARELATIAALGDPLAPLSIAPDESLMATGSENRLVGVWRIGLEQRDHATLAAQLACRSPWMLDGLALTPRSTHGERCDESTRPEGVAPSGPA